ncbi:hypothetical protein [Methanolobus sp. WCC5]|uniref:hypothetical protein n=1 Tax=Methanolobus sp. WCC5 TaxID=3125785 RepID=UPI003251014B
MSEKTNIPLLKDDIPCSENKEETCSSCSTGGCCGGFGIVAGSKKEVVMRNIFLYVGSGIIMFTVAYLIMRLISWING